MSTQAVAMTGGQQISRYDRKEIVDTIKATVAKGASDAQLRLFLEVCKRTGLDPFLKEVWFVAEKNMIMAGRDGYLRVANEHPMFDGIETRVERDNGKLPIKAVCTVWRKDRTHPTICEAYYFEYKKDSPVWKQYPSAMIGKVAEVLALKRSFAINGVVSEEEIGDPSPQAVAESKITQMQAGASYAEVSVEKTEKPKKTSVKDRLAEFAAMKERIGSERYYVILGSFGFEHANDIKDVEKQREVYREMLAEAVAQESRPQPMFPEQGGESGPYQEGM